MNNREKQMTKTQVLEFTSAFPPAEKLTEVILDIDYAKQVEVIRQFVITVAAFVAAFVTVVRDRWVQHDMTERVQITLLEVQARAQKVARFVTELREANATLV